MHMSREVLEEEHGRNMPALGSCERTLAGPTKEAQGTLPVLLGAMGRTSNTDTANLSCFSFLSGHGFIVFFH